MFTAFWAAQRGPGFTAPQIFPLKLAFAMLPLLQMEKTEV